jgi:hypothetical protein
VFLSGTGAYQWLEYQETNTDILTGNTLATNSNSAITVTVWDHNGPQTITNSYVYGGAPGWWGANHWPAIGPDVSPKIGMIPAQERFLGIPVPPPVVSVTLSYSTDIFKTGSPIGFTSFNVSRTGSTGSPLTVLFYLGGDGTALSSPNQNYNPCDAYNQLDFTASGCSQVPAPNVFQASIPAGQSSVTISVQAVDSETLCDGDTQSLPFIIIPTSSYTVDSNNFQLTVTVHADPGKWDPQ